jgi:hypothetical protein
MPYMEIPSPTPRRVRRPSWLDLRLVLGVLLVAAAVLIGAEVVQSARHTDKELAVTRDLAAGTTLQAADLHVVDVALPDSAKRAHVYVSDPARAVGRVLAHPLSAGELLPAAVLTSAPGRTTVSVPFASDAAPKLSRGERIVVWLSTKQCPSVVLLADVTVQDVHPADASEFSSGGGGQDVVLSVSAPLAQRVVTALAIDDATIRAGVLTGAADPDDGAALPTLDTCTASSAP